MITVLIRRDSNIVSSLSSTTSVIQLITRHLQQTNDFGGLTAIASISDDHFVQFLNQVVDVLRLVNSSSFVSYPISVLLGILPTFVTILPYQARPCLLEPICTMLTQLMIMDLISDSVCLSFVIQQVGSLSALPTPTAIQNSRILSDFCYHFVLHKPTQFTLLLDACISIFDETPSKKARASEPSLSDHTPLLLYLLLLDLFNSLLLEVNRNNSALLDASFVDSFTHFRLELVQYFARVVLPSQRVGAVAQAIREDELVLKVCVKVCLVQLLEQEKELRRRLARFIELCVKGEEVKENRQQEDECVIVFDGARKCGVVA